jgi:hypothetical protein
MLGHQCIDTTAHYTAVATKTIAEVPSPLDRILTRRRRSVLPKPKTQAPPQPKD